MEAAAAKLLVRPVCAGVGLALQVVHSSTDGFSAHPAAYIDVHQGEAKEPLQTDDLKLCGEYFFPATDLHEGQHGLIPNQLMIQLKQNVWNHGSSTGPLLLFRQKEQASPRLGSAASSATLINAMLTVIV